MESNRYDGLCRYVLEVRASIAPEILTDRTGAASWQGVSRAPQYSASKHGVLGLMRALDASTAEDNIRIAVIHPWFAGAFTVLCAVIPISIFLKRYHASRTPHEAFTRGHSIDAHLTYSGRCLPRGDGPGPCDEWVSLGVT